MKPGPPRIVSVTLNVDEAVGRLRTFGLTQRQVAQVLGLSQKTVESRDTISTKRGARPLPPSFARIARRLSYHGDSNRDIARILGISPATVHKFIKGEE